MTDLICIVLIVGMTVRSFWHLFQVYKMTAHVSIYDEAAFIISNPDEFLTPNQP